MKRFLKLFLVLALSIASTSVYSQLDKTHYIPPFFAPETASSSVGKQWIVLSTQKEESFDVVILQGYSVYDTVSISKSAPQIILLGDGFASATNPTGILDEDSLNVPLSQQGYKLSAEYPFFTAVYQKSTSQGDILTCKGETALGTEFYSGHIVSNYSTSDDKRGLFTSVMAAFDNTSITISNDRVLYQNQSQNTITVTLDKNECYIVGTSNANAKAKGYVLNDYNGTKITSNKPVAVNTGSWCGSPNTGNSRDIGIDQLVPVNFVGNEYVAMQGAGTTIGEQIIVVATSDNTDVYVNSTLVCQLDNQGDYHVITRDKYSSNKNMYINSTNNIYVYQTLSGKYSDVSVGLCFLPPLSCLSNREVNISFANKIGNPILSLIAEEGASITINNKSITESSSTVVGNSDWVTYQVKTADLKDYDASLTSFEIVSTKAINAALSFQSDNIGGAGYYSGFGNSPLLQVTPTVDGTEACYPDNAILLAGGYDDYVWYLDGEVISGEVDSCFMPIHTGTYRVSGRTSCGLTKASDPYILQTCLSLEGGGVFPEDTGDVMVLMRLGIISEEDVSYWYRTQSVTATEGLDFVSSVGQGTILAGDSIDTLYLSINDDDIYESIDEKFTFDVYASLNSKVKNQVLEFSIQDNDAMPTVEAPAELTVAENSDSLKITFVKNGFTQDSLFFDYATADGTAEKGIQYTETSGTFYFTPEEYVKYIYIPIEDNNHNDYAKVFSVDYSAPSHVTLVSSSTTVTISDDETATTPLTFVANVDSVEEGGVIKFDVHLGQVEGIDITYFLTLNNMTTDAADFTQLVSKLFTLKAGITDTTFSIQTTEDTIPEADEIFSYSFGTVSGATPSPDAKELTILNDDYIPTLTADKYEVAEDASISGNVLDNDVILGDTPVVVAFIPPASGTLTNHGKGDFSYTPLADFFGVIDFSYTVTDKSGDRREALVNIEVKNENDLPIANHDTISTGEDTVSLFFPMVNDVDVDKSGLKLESVSGATLGSADVEGDYIVYTPTANVFGKDTLSYFITDGEDDGATAYIYMTINPGNDIPLAEDDSYTLNEGDATVSLDVLANDIDVDLDGLLIFRIYDVVGGTASIIDNKVDYTLFENFWGVASFSYTLVDGESDSASADVIITVNPVNDLPVANADHAQTNEDFMVVIDVLSNDVDDDKRGLALDSMSAPTNGSVSEVAGVVTYTPSEDSCGVDSFIYYISDYNGDVASAKVYVTINCIGDAPEAVDDSYTLTEDDGVVLWDVLANDVDKDNCGIRITSIYGVTSGGSAIIVGDEIQYTLDANFNGNAAFNYVITDGDSDKDTASVTVAVASVVDFPIVDNDEVTTNEDESVNILPLANDDDVEGVGFNIKTLGVPHHGSLTQNANEITYFPEENYNGRDSFEYQVLDNNGKSASAWVKITIDSVPDFPVGQDDNYTIDEDALKSSFDVISNDEDIDGDGLTLGQIISVTTGVADVVNGQLEYTPEANFNGEAFVKYTVLNPNADKDTATVKFTISALNDDPIAVNDSVTTNEDVSKVIDVLDNDEDIDNSTIKVDRVVNLPKHGTVVCSENNIEYTPEANYHGLDSFVYVIKDGEGDEASAKVVVTVKSVYDAPITYLDSVLVNEDIRIEFNPLANDEDPDGGGLFITDFSIAKHGSINITGGKCYYMPELNFYGEDSVKYTAEDADGGFSVNWVFFTITPINDYPIAKNDKAEVDEDKVVVVDALANDKDIDGTGLSICNVGLALHGTVAFTAGAVTYTPEDNYFGADSFLYYIKDDGEDIVSAKIKIDILPEDDDAPVAMPDSVEVEEDNGKVLVYVLANDIDVDNSGLTILADVDNAKSGTAVVEGQRIAYTADDDFFGNDTVSYIIKDGESDFDTTTLIIKVSPVNDFPKANNDNEVTTEEDVAITIDVLANDEDVDKSIITVDSVYAAYYGELDIQDGKVTYTPEKNYYGRDSFVYFISDGEDDVATAEVKINVTRVNEIPVANDDSFSLLEDAGETALDVLYNDVDVDKSGLVIFDVKSAQGGKLAISNHQVIYTPIVNYYGADTLTYVIRDAENDYDTAQVYLDIQFVNDLPQANDDNVETDEDQMITVDVLFNDIDIDRNGLSVDSIGEAYHGLIVEGTNAIKYYPNVNFYGRDSFNYYITDADGDIAYAMVKISVEPVDERPEAKRDTFTLEEDASKTAIDVLANDIDIDVSGLEIFAVDGALGGDEDIENNQIVYTPWTNFFGNDTLRYIVKDGENDFDTAYVYLKVTAVNDNPIAVLDVVVTSEDSTIMIDVLGNDMDIDRSLLQLDSISTSLNAKVSIIGNQVQYVPSTNFFGNDFFEYFISDGEDDVATARVELTVNPRDDAPVALPDSFVIQEDADVASFDVLANDVSIDLKTLHLFEVFDVVGGEAHSNLNMLTFKPSPNFFGEARLSYVIDDKVDGKDTSWVIIDVEGVNDAPKPKVDKLTCAEDSSIVLNLLQNDIDVDKSGLSIDSVYAPLYGTVTMLNDTMYYTPNTNFCGLDSFRYDMKDDNDQVASRVYIDVKCVNDAPVAYADSVWATEDVAKVFFPMNNDVDPDDAIFSIVFDAPSHGTISISEGNYFYTSSLNFNGEDSVEYTITDTYNLTSKAKVYFNVSAVNDAPVAINDTLTLEEDSVSHFYPLANDVDVEDEALTQITVYREPKLGAYSLQGTEIIYTPKPNVWGADTMTYVVRDSADALSNLATIYITINSVNEAPILTNLSVVVEFEVNDTTAVLLYAEDPDGGGLELFSVAGASHGASFIFDNKLIYEPELGFLGHDTVVFEVKDGDGDIADAEVYYNVVSFYEAPVAHHDTLRTFEDVELVMLPTLNDMEAEKVAKCDLVILRQPQLGTYEQNGDMITYTPEANIWGEDTMTYELRDSNHIGSEIVTISITIDSVNESPLTSTVAVSLDEDATDTTELLSLASDPDFSGLSLSLSRAALHGSSLVVDSRLAYTPDANFAGMDTAYYWITDGEGDATESFVSYNVSQMNDVPVANFDSFSVFEDDTLIMSPLLNDVDVEDLTLTDFSLLSGPTLGAVDIDSLNLIYIPKANIWGDDSIIYVVYDSEHARSEEATIYITIDSVNEAPRLANVNVNVTEEASDTTDVISLAQDVDFSGLTLSSVKGATFGDVSLWGDAVVYTPQKDFAGKDTVYYSVRDGENDSTVASIYYSIIAVNDAPEASDDYFTVSEDSFIVVFPLLNDVDAEDSVLLDLTVQLQPAFGKVEMDSVLTYTPQANFWGQDSMTYVVRDAQGMISNLATIYFTVDSVNEAPVLLDIRVELDEDGDDSTYVLTSALDPDFSGLKLAEVGAANYGSVSTLGDVVVYTPQADFFGNDTLAYFVHDGENDTAMAYLYYDVQPVNDVPVAINDMVSTDEDSVLIISSLNNDVDAEDSVLLDFKIVSLPTLGSVILDSLEIIYTPKANVWGQDSIVYVAFDAQRTMSEEATIYISIDSVNEKPMLSNIMVTMAEDMADTANVLTTAFSPDFSALELAVVDNGQHGIASVLGSKVLYIPEANFAGKDTVAYFVSDGENDTTKAYLYYTITPENDAPIAVNDTMRIFEDNVLLFSPMSNDVDCEDTALIDFVILSYPTLGVAKVDSLNIEFTPHANVWGYDSMTYLVCDAQRLMSEVATIYITIDSVNEGPVLQDVNIIVTEDGTDTTHVLSNAQDPDGSGLQLASVGVAMYGTVSLLGDSVIYTPQADFIGKDTVAYYVHDGENDTTLAYLYYRVIPVNDAPVAQNDTLRLLEDTRDSIYLLANDTDAEDTVLNHFIVVDGPRMGTYTTDSVTVFYTPNSNVWGLDSMTYRAADRYTVESELATIYFFVDSVNELPILTNLTVNIEEDQQDTSNVLLTALDPDFSGLTLAKVANGQSGMASIWGASVVYSPMADFVGKDTVTYYVHDGENDTSIAYIYYTINDENDAPIAINDTVYMVEDMASSVLVLANDTDAEDLALYDFTIVEAPQLGTYTQDSVTLYYTPNSNVWGVDSMTYKVADQYGAFSNEAVIYFYIDSVNEAPIVRDTAIVMLEDAVDTIDVLLLAQSPDNSVLTLVAVGEALNGNVIIVNQKLEYTPRSNFNGLDSVSFTITDGEGDSATAQLTVEVTAVNDVPIAHDDSYSETVEMSQWLPLTLAVANNDEDVDVMTLQGQVEINVHPTSGQAIIAVNPLEIVYIPTTGFVGIDSLSYHLIDNEGATSNVAWVYITISQSGKNLYAVNDSITLMEDATMDFNPMANDVESTGDSIFINVNPADVEMVDGVNYFYTRNGHISMYNDSSWQYSPKANFYGADTASYILSNTRGEVDTATIIINVTPINDAPVCTLRPTLSGEVLPDSIVTCDKGLWSDVDGDLSYTYSWYALGEDGLVVIDNTKDSLMISDSLLNTKVYCEVLATDNGYPLPGISTMAVSDTVSTRVSYPQGIELSQDTLYRTWEDGHEVAQLSCEGAEEIAHTFELMNGNEMFSIVGDKLYLDTSAYFIEEDSLTISIKISHNDMGGMSAIFDVTLMVVNDLVPVMNTDFPKLENVFGDSVTAIVMADIQGVVYYAVQEAGDDIPNAVDLQNIVRLPFDGQQELILGMGQLTSQKDYEIVIYLCDTSERYFSSVYVVPFTTADILAPVFLENSPYVLRTTEDSALVMVYLDEAAELSYTLYENDNTITASGDVVLDSALVADEVLRIEQADSGYCILLGGLRSQIAYQLVLRATDSLLNQGDYVELDFTTRDTVTPFFVASRPNIKSIVDGHITYTARSSEDGILHTRLAYAADELSDFTTGDALGVYSETTDVAENVALSVETDALTMDGLYRLDFALEDSAGNTSILRSVEFTYPQNIGVRLVNAFIYRNEQLEFINVIGDMDYKIVTMKGATMRRGTLAKDAPTINVNYLNSGVYIVYVSSRLESKSFRFVKTTSLQPLY